MLEVAVGAALSLTGAAGIVAATVQTTKFLLNRLSAPGAPNQNNIVRMYVYAVALIVVAGYNFLGGQDPSRAAALVDIVTGGTVAGLAITGFHILTSTTSIPLASYVTSISPFRPAVSASPPEESVTPVDAIPTA